MEAKKTKIKAVIFDLGRVLVNVDLTRGLYRYAGIEPDGNDVQVMEKFFKDPLFIGFGTGKLKPQDFHKEICKRMGIEMDYETFKRVWCDVFDPMDDIESLFGKVAERYPVGLLSDLDPLHWEYLQPRLPFLKKIKKPTLSFETGVLKPHPDSYRIAAQNVGKEAQNCLFIDDRLINVQGARKAGMQAVRFENVDKLQQDLERWGILGNSQ